MRCIFRNSLHIVDRCGTGICREVQIQLHAGMVTSWYSYRQIHFTHWYSYGQVQLPAAIVIDRYILADQHSNGQLQLQTGTVAGTVTRQLHLQAGTVIATGSVYRITSKCFHACTLTGRYNNRHMFGKIVQQKPNLPMQYICTVNYIHIYCM